VRGGSNAVESSGRDASGDGSAARSTLPFGVSGSSAIGTNADGIM
jgi:hypothetical protein